MLSDVKMKLTDLYGNSNNDNITTQEGIPYKFLVWICG